MKKDISPEERLLRLIKGEKEEAKFTPLDSKHLTGFTSQKLIDRPAFISFKRYLNIECIEKSLFVFFLISLIYLILTFSLTLVPKKKDFPLLPKKQEKEEESLEIKPFNFYLEAINKKPIFSSELTDTTKSAETTVGLRATELISNLKLLGIISGENPQVIIEDTKIQKTYFLKQGEFIGEFQLAELGEGKVTLNYQGQRFDLFL